MIDLANGGQVGIDAVQAPIPIGPEAFWHIRKSIHAQTIEAGRLAPPNRILQKILRNRGIFRIQVRQYAEEPAIGETAVERRRRVRIRQSLKKIVRLRRIDGAPVERSIHSRGRIQVLLHGPVKPIRQRRILYPRMQRTDMVRHDVEKNLHLLLMRSSDKFAIVVERPEMWLHSVEIHSSVTVVILCRAILYNRREPKCRDSQIL